MHQKNPFAMEGFIKETLQDNIEHILLLCYVLLTQPPETLHMIMTNSENTVKEKGKGSYLETVP